MSFSRTVKFLRYASIYGIGRTAFKAAGRLRLQRWPQTNLFRREAKIGIIGCGQFAFSTIGYFINRCTRAGISACFDINGEAAQSFARFYRVPHVAQSAQSVITDPHVEIVYITSNHASHHGYAIQALQEGKAVYVEKPIAVDLVGLGRLAAAARRSDKPIFSGYNRPFSKAVRSLRLAVTPYLGSRMTLACFVSGHVLPAHHWYRDPAEGTRICGNVGHWLDLAVHMLLWRGLPDRWNVTVTWSDPSTRDDNLSIALVSEFGDLVSIIITSRTEPFEGINETINLQWGEVIAKIDDFRRLSLWLGSRLVRRSFWPKDVGHRSAVLQPFGEDQFVRPFEEVITSSLLTLHIADMVRTSTSESSFSFKEARLRLTALQSDD